MHTAASSKVGALMFVLMPRKADVARSLGILTERECLLLSWRYCEMLTMDQVAKKIHGFPDEANYLLACIIRKLRRHLLVFG